MKAKKLITLCLVGMLAVASTSSVFASTSASGDADFVLTYSDTAGPTGPTDPNDPTGGANNWAVTYPKAITLTDSNSAETTSVVTSDITAGMFAGSGADKPGTTTAAATGKQLSFTVNRSKPGTDGNGLNVTTDNVGNGIKVTVAPGSTYNWGNDSTTHKGLISMKAGTTTANGVYLLMLESNNAKTFNNHSTTNPWLVTPANGTTGDSITMAFLKPNAGSGTNSTDNVDNTAKMILVDHNDASDPSVGVQDDATYTSNVQFKFTKDPAAT